MYSQLIIYSQNWCSLGWPQIPYVAEAGLELLKMFLTLLPSADAIALCQHTYILHFCSRKQLSVHLLVDVGSIWGLLGRKSLFSTQPKVLV